MYLNLIESQNLHHLYNNIIINIRNTSEHINYCDAVIFNIFSEIFDRYLIKVTKLYGPFDFE